MVSLDRYKLLTHFKPVFYFREPVVFFFFSFFILLMVLRILAGNFINILAQDCLDLSPLFRNSCCLIFNFLFFASFFGYYLSCSILYSKQMASASYGKTIESFPAITVVLQFNLLLLFHSSSFMFLLYYSLNAKYLFMQFVWEVS